MVGRGKVKKIRIFGREIVVSVKRLEKSKEELSKLKYLSNNLKNFNFDYIRNILVVAFLISLFGLLIHFGPRMLGFAILQQEAANITLQVGTFTRATSWNTTGLVAWWRFDEGSGTTAADSSGNGNGGTLKNATDATCFVNGACPDWTDVAFSGKALRFDGKGDYVEVADKPEWDFGNNDFTVEVWFNSKEIPSSGGDAVVGHTGSNVNQRGWDLNLRNTGSIMFLASSDGTSWGFNELGSSTICQVNTWYHAAVTRDGNEWKLYLNGILEDTNSTPFTINNPSVPLKIGANGIPEYFNGTIDEVKIWNRSLSAEEIWHEYKGRSGIYTNWTTRTEPYACDDYTVALYHFDEGSGTTTTDVCQGNDGTFYNATNVNWVKGKFGKAIRCNGINNTVLIENSDSESSLLNLEDELSLELWVKPASIQPNNFPTLISKHKGTTPGSQYQLGLSGDSNNYKIRVCIETSSGDDFGCKVGNNYLLNNSWNHIIVTYDKKNVIYYLNGIIDSVYNFTNSLTYYKANVSFCSAPYFSWYLNGTIDEVRISNKSREPEEFREFYRQGAYKKQWVTEPGSEWQTISWNVSRYSKYGTELSVDDSTVLLMHFNNVAGENGTAEELSLNDYYLNNHAVLLMHFNNDSSVGEAYNTSNGTIIVDYSHGNNNGTLYTGANNGIIYSATGGKFNGAFTFDGKDDYVDCGNDASLLPDSITWEMWIKTENVGIMPAYHGSSTYRRGFYIGGTGVVRWAVRNSSGDAAEFYGNIDITDNQWHHIVGTYDQSTAKLYVDGVLDNYQTLLGPLGDPSGPLTLGTYSSALGYWFNGTIDEVAIYNRSLPAGVIAYHAGVGVKDETGVNYGVLGYGNATTSANPTWTSSGKFSKALQFDGKDDYVDCGNDSSLDITDEITIEAWIKPTNIAWMTVVEKSDSPYLAYRFFAPNNNGGMRFAASFSGNWTTHDSNNNILTAGQWNYVAVTYDGSNVKFYVNGIVDLTPSQNGTIATTTKNLLIGKDYPETGIFNGTIDEVIIYNRSLEEWEIADHYERGEEIRKVWFQTRSSTNNVTWTEWTGNVPVPQVNEQITNNSGEENGTLLLLSFDDISRGTQHLGMRGYKGWNDEERIDYTKLLLHFDEGDGSTTTTDSSPRGHKINFHGGLNVTTAQSKFGGSSLILDGGDDYLSIDDSEDWDICGSSTDDWTIDAWIRLSNTSYLDYQVVVAQAEDVNNLWELEYKQTHGWYFLLLSGGNIAVGTGWGDGIITDTNWHHVAMCKVGSKYAIYLDGQQINYKDDNSTDTFTGNLYIGYQGNNYGDSYKYFKGYIDEIRISHTNEFGASPNAAKSDTITVPAGYYADIASPGKFLSAVNISGSGTLKYPTGASQEDAVLLCRFDDSYVCEDGETGNFTILPDSYTECLYHFDEGSGTTTTDASGNGNDGTLYGSPNWTSSRSGLRNAIKFDGVDDYVDIGTDIFSNATFEDGGTLEAWIKINSFPSESDNYASFISIEGRFDLSVDYGDVARFYVNDGGTNANLYSASTLQTNKWYHVIGTIDGNSTVSLYINGILDNSTSYNGHLNIDEVSRLNTIGSHYSLVAGHFFNGTIDEVIIYNRSLSAEEVKAHYGFDTGKYGKGAYFAGKDSYVEFEDSDDLDFDEDDFSISVWIKAEPVSSWEAILEKRDTSNYKGYWINLNTTGGCRASAYDGSDQVIVRCGEEVDDNTWHHITAVYDRDSNAKIYLDGLLKDSSSMTNVDSISNSETLIIGARKQGPQMFFNGTIDEVKIYDKALTPDEIYQDYLGNINQTSGTIALWIKPSWQGNDNNAYTFYHLLDSNSLTFAKLGKDSNNNLYFELNGTILTYDITNWSKDVWQHISATWNTAEMKLYINGSAVNSTTSPSNLGSLNLSSEMYIGSNASAKEQCNCSIDDFAIYNYPKSSPKALGYSNPDGETIASAIGKYIEARAIFATRDVEKTVTLGTIIITSEDLIVWTTPAYEGTTIITGNTLTVNVNFTDTTQHLYDIVCNITHSNGSNMWGRYIGPDRVLSLIHI